MSAPAAGPATMRPTSVAASRPCSPRSSAPAHGNSTLGCGFETSERLGAFDAVLAASAMAHGATALVSADAAFAGVPGITLIPLDATDLADRLT